MFEVNDRLNKHQVKTVLRETYVPSDNMSIKDPLDARNASVAG